MIETINGKEVEKHFVDIPVADGRTIKGFKVFAEEPGYARWLDFKMSHIPELVLADGLMQAAINGCENAGVSRAIIYILMRGLVKTMEKQCASAGKKEEKVANAYTELVMFADFSYRESELTKELIGKAAMKAGSEGYA